ncbi:PE-PPE domain-containing protein [Rhodococcus phenolicus]|uniref:PE-PPE domain-containing protein n=1 Tax=Rhodococcus phenolicus TaxID=263849 RepID=UPI00082C7A8E|nr:PE-PPE domain-containing protein [Rhodococcus phenolicus]
MSGFDGTVRRTVGVLTAALAIGAASTLLTPALAAGTPAQPGTSSCPERFVLAVDGTKNVNSADSLDPESPLAQISERYRRPGTVVEHIRYPAVVVPLPDSGSSKGSDGVAYDESKAIGHSRLREAVARDHGACPDSEIVVLGYSQGAAIAGDVLAEIAADGSVPPDRIRGVLYADPRDEKGVESQFPGQVLPGITLTGGRHDFGSIRVDRICLAGDAVCDAQTPADGKGWLVEDLAGYLLLHTDYPDYDR